MVGTDYSLLDLFLTMLWFFVLVIWITTVIIVIFDIFRSRDLSGWGKAGWFIFILILPIIGVIAYLVARGTKMVEHRRQDLEAQDKAMRRYVQSVGGGETTKAGELEKLANLRDRGVLSDEEFAAQKAQLLS
jgi:ABC-type multidrug transport system fused ATPase/permease subunit